MAKVLIEEQYLRDIADAIRKMRCSHDPITTDSMAREIEQCEIVWDPEEKWQRPLDWPDYDSLNLFKNKIGKTICTVGGFFNSTGSISSDGSWYYTNYIDVKPNTSYIASSISRGGANTYYVLYDKDKKQTRTILIVANENPSFTTENNEYYVRFSIRNYNNELATAQLEEGTVATEYTPYFEGMYFTYDTSRADHYDNWVGLYCVCSGGYKVERGQIVNGAFVAEETTTKASGAIFEEWIERTNSGYVVYRLTPATGNPITSIGLRDMSTTLRTDGRYSRTYPFQPVLERYGRLPNLTTFSNWGSYSVESDTILDLKKLTTLVSVWGNCYRIENIDLTGYDSEVTSCSTTFYCCRRLRYLNCTDKLVTSKCTTMYVMFNECRILPYVDCANWDTSNVTRMDSLFCNCFNLYKADVSNWDVSKVTVITNIYSGCNKLKEIDMSNWVVTLPTSYTGLFTNCYNVRHLDLSGFDTSNVTNFQNTFSGCSVLEELDVSHFNTSNVTNMYGMFNSCMCLNSLDLSNFDTSNVTTFQSMFNACINLKNLDISNFDLSKATNINSFLWGFSENANQVILPADMTTGRLTNADYAFGNNYSIHELDLTGVDFSGITTPNYVCRYNHSMEKIILPESLHYIAQYFFGDCRNLKTIVMPSTTLVTLTNTNAFSGANRDKTIYVPDNLVSSYQTANNWKSLSHVTFAGLSTYTE